MRPLALLLFFPASAWACERCIVSVNALIYGPDFSVNVLRMLAPLALIAGIAVAIYFLDKRGAK